MIFGDLPPYEAFPIGGTNSVRGYSEGGIGSGRNYVAGTAEMHWPLFKPLEVCLEPTVISLWHCFFSDSCGNPFYSVTVLIKSLKLKG